MRFCRLTALAILAAAMFAPSALADTTNSSNWAGYAVHRSGVSFRTVSATWMQPHVSCTAGKPGFSAYWVGIGGYKLDSRALEQAGTELDCTPDGNVISTAWYELVPDPSTTIMLTVRPGDLVRATVAIHRHRVTIRIYDLTRHRGFHKSVYASTIDPSSAEWIVEAPSECVSASSCQTLPLADFATAMFGSASARSTAGHIGAISDRAWDWTRINLTPGGRRFAAYHGQGPAAGAAAPSPLLARGRSFAVNYALAAAPSDLFRAGRRTAVRTAAMAR